MRIYNYVRPLWSNGVHVVHDVPEGILEALKRHFGPGSVARLANDDVQVARLEESGLTLAWILLDVELPTENTNFSYRRARYLHVIVSPDPAWHELDVQSARTLFSEVYGEDPRHGIAAGQAVLQTLAYPQDANEASDLFVGRGRNAASEPSGPARPLREPDPWRIIEPLPVPEPRPPFAPAPNPAPAWVTLGQLAREPTRDPVAFDPADAEAEVESGSGASASLSALLRGRLSDEFPLEEGELTSHWPALAEDSSSSALEDSQSWRSLG
ncbi:MAG: hypothetical protein JRG92_03410 [Deltaproteobacteria bacterium]|nr:hypothetical protein [Deltaproteobacteria bacterium]